MSEIVKTAKEINSNDEWQKGWDRAILRSISSKAQQVVSPPHYTEGRIYEPRKVIYDWGLNFNLGNVVKYISRAGRKDGEDALIDLHKARQYLEFEIEEIENARNS